MGPISTCVLYSPIFFDLRVLFIGLAPAADVLMLLPDRRERPRRLLKARNCSVAFRLRRASQSC